MSLKSSWVLFYLTILHIIGIYLFTRGFLLSRLSLSTVTTCTDPSTPCTLPPTHKRAVLLIIDALRFDFLSPHTPEPPSPYHHNVLTLPRELTATQPRHSFLFNAHADPPTTTLQRIKGIVTGSLPTFVDMGHNFGGSSIDEDSIVKQLTLANKTVAFMGDDTWLSVFPDSFHPNMTHEFDSFNVEDLHTVDNGVVSHLFPLLTTSPHSKEWDFLIGHFLGVDHVGHRVGPDHPTMRAKQEQMNDVLRQVVDALDEDTLLVVMGDHGMDRRGDHGGDGDLEVSSALWIYSKGKPLSMDSPSLPDHLLSMATFPDVSTPHRSVQQIDLLPSLSLLLGLPIPFNNLGTIIPELFWRDKSGTEYIRALDINVRQIERYLSTYRASSSGGELDGVWQDLQAAWTKASDPRSSTKRLDSTEFTRLALETCRSLWAQFNVSLMGFGLVTLGLGVGVGWSLYQGSGRAAEQWADINNKIQKTVPLLGAAGATMAGLGFVPLQGFSALKGVSPVQFALFGAALTSGVGVVVMVPPKIRVSWSTILLILHPLAFLSNSYTFWEDRFVPFFLLTTLVPAFLAAFYAPKAQLRQRILGFSFVFAVCVRLMTISTVCREEQHPWCSVTFFAGATVAEPPLAVLISVAFLSILLPQAVRRFMAITKADHGAAEVFLPYIFTPTLVAGTAYWLLEWVDSAQLLGDGYNLRVARTIIARCAMGGILAAGGALFIIVPTCLHVTQERLPTDDGKEGGKTQVIILGFANAFGSPYLIFWCIAFGLVWVSSQLTGQVTLSLAAIAMLAHLEIVDSMRDAQAIIDAFATNPTVALELLQSQAGSPTTAFSRPVSLDEILPIALLALHAFYTTGHQSTISSIQWKSAFVLTPTVSYPFSPLVVILNTFGPVFLFALAVPLVALWKVAPLNVVGQASPMPTSSAAVVSRGTIRASLGAMVYFSVLLMGSAVSSAFLRRHLMVWKVFAPRYMAGATGMIAVDVGVLLGVWVGAKRVLDFVGGMFQEKAR
ncbi:hypothetical protein OF83DRAFT_1129538 [Amylostereum chailletii]|nr:hypothetical protein OF83DRAFT_1129538 [Amylostereum chailletii]